jgi:hypothetical protein
VLTRRPDAPLPGDAGRIVGDPASGAGLDAAVRDAGMVVHLATSPFRAARIDCGGTRALAEAITRRGSGLHLV